MPLLRRLYRLLVLTALAVVILAISGVVANELAGGTGTTSRIYSFMHRLPLEVNGHGTEYEIGHMYIVHRSRLIRPLHSIRFAVEWEEPTRLFGSGRGTGDQSRTIASMIDGRFPDVPADIRAAWAASVSGMVQLVLRDGPDAALTIPNQERDLTTFSSPLPESGIPTSVEIFRQGRIVIYPPSLRILSNNLSVFLAVWVVGIVLLALTTKAVAERIRRSKRTSQPTVLQTTGFQMPDDATL